MEEEESNELEQEELKSEVGSELRADEGAQSKAETRNKRMDIQISMHSGHFFWKEEVE